MSTYIINWTSNPEGGPNEGVTGKAAITLPPATVNDTASSLKLTGRATITYGEIQQENFLRLLEHFTSGNPPPHPTVGQVWYQYNAATPGQSKLRLYTATTTWDYVPTASTDHAITGSWTFPTPTGPSSPATKSYVDAVALGLQVKPAVEVVVTSPGTLGAFTYNNGTAGVGATLTASANGAFPPVDGVTLTSTVTGQNGVLIAFTGGDLRNGRYVLTQVGDGSNPWVLTRCGLCDEASEIPGSYTFVKRGTVYAGSGWVQTVTNPVTFTVGTDPVFVTQFSGAGALVAGTGINITGNVIALQSGVVAPGTYSSVTVDTYGRVTAGGTVTIDASQVVSGTLSDLRLSSNVALKNAPNVFTANQQIIASSGGAGLTVNGVPGLYAVDLNSPADSSNNAYPLRARGNATGAVYATVENTSATGTANLRVAANNFNARLKLTCAPAIGVVGTETNHPLYLRTDDIDRLTISTGGNVTINTPTSSGPALTVDGDSNLNGHVYVNGGGTTELRLVSSANSELWFYNSSQPVDNKLWVFLTSGSDLQLRTYDDAGSNSNSALTFKRSGLTPSYITTYGDVYAGYNHSGVGSTGIHAADATHSGYISFNSPTATRVGYIGWATAFGTGDNGTLTYVAGTHAFYGDLTVSGSAPGRLLALTIYDVPGTYSYIPPAGTYVLEITVVGGGGGGLHGGEYFDTSSSTYVAVKGPGGGGGGAAIVYYRNVAIATWVATVGAGGAGSSSVYQNGNNGGASTVVPPSGGPTIYGYGGGGAIAPTTPYLDDSIDGAGGTAFAPITSGTWGVFMGRILRYGDHALGDRRGGSSLYGRATRWHNSPENGIYGAGGSGGFGSGPGGAAGNGGDGLIIFKAYG
jgi:hypothetical protein